MEGGDSLVEKVTFMELSCGSGAELVAPDAFFSSVNPHKCLWPGC